MSAAYRRQARVIALQTLYEIDSSHHLAEDVLRRNLDEPPTENTNPTQPPDTRVREYARAIVEGVIGHETELDHVIEECAPSWPLDQMARIDKCILRLAIFEILFDNRVPLKAAINEAVELSKRFGSESSSCFVNGVLGTVAATEQERGHKLKK